MEEYFDILNPDGSKTGESKPRSTVHRDGDWHRAINLWIINSKKEILIQQRSAQKDSYPEFWDLSVCGHISAGEDSITTVYREANEELGIHLNKEKIEFILSSKEQHILNNGTFIDNEYRDIYVIEQDFKLEEFHLQESEVQKIEWLSLQKFHDEYYKKTRKYVPHDLEYKKLFPLLLSR